MAQRTYSGFAPAGRQTLPTRTVAFERGAPVDVTDDEAAVLDEAGDWDEPKPKKTPTPQASAAGTKEP